MKLWRKPVVVLVLVILLGIATMSIKTGLFDTTFVSTKNKELTLGVIMGQVEQHKSNDICDVNGCEEKADELIDTGLYWREIGLCAKHGSKLRTVIDATCEKVGLFLATGEI